MMARTRIPIFVMVVTMLCSAAVAEPASELLEKAIFTEETVGDLDAAIGIYKQILDDAEANRALAARAQFRLAQCYMKKGQDTEAAEAFEKLIENYPDQKELVAQARQEMPGRLVVGPVPWQDGEVMRMSMKLPTGLEIGTWAWTADRVFTDNDAEAWRVRTRRYVAINGTQGVSGVVAEAESFRPISSWFEHSLIGDVEAIYTPTEVIITGEGRGEDSISEVALNDVVYDNEQAVQLIRRLPLEVGYKTNLPVFVTFTGKRLDVGLVVEQEQTVTVPAGRFECYKVVLEIENILHQTFWYSADANRYLVKLSAEGIIGELISAMIQVQGETADYEDERFGFSLSAPAGWYLYEHGSDGPDESVVHFVDPDATAIYVLDVDSIESTGVDTTKPLRELAETHIEKISLRREDYKVRQDSWVERTVNGSPAISFTADFVERDNPMAEYRTTVMGGETAASFKVVCEVDNLDTAKTQIDQVIATYKAK